MDVVDSEAVIVEEAVDLTIIEEAKAEVEVAGTVIIIREMKMKGIVTIQRVIR